jgi:hypothetical protein
MRIKITDVKEEGGTVTALLNKCDSLPGVLARIAVLLRPEYIGMPERGNVFGVCPACFPGPDTHIIKVFQFRFQVGMIFPDVTGPVPGLLKIPG